MKTLKKYFTPFTYINVYLIIFINVMCINKIYAANVTAGTSNYNISATSAGGNAFTSSDNLTVNGWSPTYTLTADVTVVNLTVTDGVTLNCANYNLTVTGTLTVSGNAVITGTETSGTKSITCATFTWTGNNDWSTTNYDLTLGGNYSPANRSIATNGGNITITGNVSLTNSQYITTGGGNATLQGTVTLANGSYINVGAGNVTVASTYSSGGDWQSTQRIEFTNGTATFNGNVTIGSKNAGETGIKCTGTGWVVFAGTTLTASDNNSLGTITKFKQTGTGFTKSGGGTVTISTTFDQNCIVAPTIGAGLFSVTGSTINATPCGTTYYGCDGTDLSVTANATNWTTVNNCTGSNPTNMTTAVDVFTVETGESGTFSTSRAIGGTFTINGTFTPGATAVLSSTGTLNGTSGTIKVTHASGFSTQYAMSTNTLTGLTVDYSTATGGQTVSGITYTGNLKTSNTSGTQTLGANTTVNGTLNVGAGSTLSLSDKTLGSPTSTTIYNGSAASTISGTGVFTLGGTLTVTDNGADGVGATISCPLALGANRIISVADDAVADDLTISGIISGGFTLDKQGSGKMVVSGANTYTGATTITTGILNVQNNTGLGTTAGGVTISDGTVLELQGGITVGAEALSIRGTGISNGGALRNISGNNTYGGALTLQAATEIQNDGGTFTISGGISGTQNLTFDAADAIAVSGAITISTGTLTKNNVGTLTLSGTNTYTGTTTISGGSLALGGNNVLAVTTIQLNGGDFSTGAGAGFTDVVGDLDVDANSTITLGTSSSITFTTSTDQTWAGSTLTIYGWTGTSGSAGTAGRIYVGVAGLDASQLAKITFNTFSAGATILGTGELVPAGANWYYEGAGSLHDVANWTEIAVGTPSTNPANFSTGAVTYNIRNAASATLSSAWTVSGTDSKIVVGNGTDAFNFTIPSGSALTTTSPVVIDVAANGTLTLSNTSIPTLGGLSTTSTVNYAITTGGQTITSATYGNLTASNTSGSQTAGGNLGVEGTLITTASGVFDLSTYTLSGTLGTITNNGTIKTQNSSATPINTGKTWGGTVEYNRSGTQTVSNGTYNNLTISGSNTKTLKNNTTVSAALIVKANNTLDLSTYTLGSPTSVTMENGSAAAIISGSGVMTLGGNITINDDGGNGTGATISCPVALGGNRTVTIADDAVAVDLIMSGIISGVGNSLQKAGTGTLTLSGVNTFAGGLNFTAGGLNINNASALGTGTFTIASGTIDNTSGGTITNSQNNVQSWNSDFTYTGSYDLNLGTGAVTLGADRQVTVTASTLTVGGAIGGSFALTKAGTGTMVLTGNSGYTGLTTVSAGVLNIRHANALGTTGAGTSVTSGAALEIQGTITTAAEALTLNGSGISSNGALRNITNNNTFAGAITLGSASTIQSDANTLTLSSTIANGGTLLTMEGAGDITSSSVISGTGGLTKNDAGILLLSGGNTYQGTTTLNAGTLKINHATALGTGTFTIAGGTIDNTSGGSITLSNNNVQNWNADYTFTGSNALNLGTGAVTLSANRQVTVNGSTLTIGGAIGGGAYSLTKAGTGTMILNGNNGYTGNTIISAGTLTLGSADRINNSSNLILNGGTFSTGASTGNNETMADLDFDGAAATIALGTGAHDIHFTASNDQTWSVTTLTITGWTGVVGSIGTAGKIFVGTDATGLSGAQLAKITFTGFSGTPVILSTGEVVPPAPDVALSSANPAVAANDIAPGSTNKAIYRFATAVTVGTATINSVAFTTTGTYAAADLTNFQLWYSTTDNFAGASSIKTITTSLGTGAHTFSSLTQTTAAGATGYFWVSFDVAAGATVNNTVTVSALTTSDLTYAAANKSGSTNAGGTQTLKWAYACNNATCTPVSGTTNYSAAANDMEYCLQSGTWTGTFSYNTKTNVKLCINGTWTTTGAISYDNDNCFFDNVGTVSAASIGMARTGSSFINRTGGFINITGSTNFQTGTVTNKGTLISNGFNTIQAALDNQAGGMIIDTSTGQFQLSNSGTTTNAGTIRVGAKFDAISSLNNSGKIILRKADYAITDQAMVMENGSTLTNSGTITVASGQVEFIGVGSNTSTGSVNIQNGNLKLNTAVTFDNAGSLHVSGTGAKISAINAGISNGGTVIVDDGDVEVMQNGDHMTNNGRLILSGATRTLKIGGGGAATFDNYGLVSAPNLTLGNSGTLNNYCSMSFSGDFIINGPSVVVRGTTTSGEVSKFSVGGTSTWVNSSNSFGGASQNIDFCDAGSESCGACGWDNKNSNTEGGTVSYCTRTADGNAACDNLFLPIKLLYFKGSCNDNNSITLNWGTSSEKNNDKFYIERSFDGINYEVLYYINGAGNSNKKIDYTTEDTGSQFGINYYRLTQVDYDGNAQSFPVIAVTCEPELMRADLSIVPNPIANNEVVFSIADIDAQNVSISITDEFGRTIYTGTKDIENNQLNTIKLNGAVTKGMYVIHITSPQMNLAEKMFVR